MFRQVEMRDLNRVHMYEDEFGTEKERVDSHLICTMVRWLGVSAR
jgi:hypothetical protein